MDTTHTPTSSCLVPDGCPDPDTGMPCNECWSNNRAQLATSTDTLTYCGRWPFFDHTGCPSSVECYHATTLCASCDEAPAGHGHFMLYCVPCAR